jgi:hypothetical protein
VHAGAHRPLLQLAKLQTLLRVRLFILLAATPETGFLANGAALKALKLKPLDKSAAAQFVKLQPLFDRFLGGGCISFVNATATQKSETPSAIMLTNIGF